MAIQDSHKSDDSQLTRRGFLKTSTGAIALTVIGMPSLFGQTATAQGFTGTPGVATQRIEGRRKVTGEKIFARDYNSRDLKDQGWPSTQWYGLYLRALTTTRAFEGLDKEKLKSDANPVRIVTGDMLDAAQASPQVSNNRDCAVDEKIAEAQAAFNLEQVASGALESFDRPRGLDYDLIVMPGQRPDYLGQAVALLLFDSAAAFRKGRAAIQFNDAAYQKYGPEIGPDPDDRKVLWPETLYVRVADEFNPATGFSYFSAPDPDTYTEDAKPYIKGINDYLETTPDLITQNFIAEMDAMDPMFMEPEAGLIWQNPNDMSLNVVLGTQSPDGDVRDIALMYSEPESPLKISGVNLISCYPGGGFGGRDKSPFSLMLAICAGFSDGNAVRLEYDRFEQFRVGLKRQACKIDGTLAALPDQTMQVIKMNLHIDSGGRKNLSPYVASLAALCAGGSYVIPMANIYAEASHSEQISAGSQRGFGGPQAFFAIETAIDDIAASQGWDPLQFRRKNLLARGGATVAGGPVDQELRLAEMLDMAEAHPLWRDRDEIKQGYRQRGLTYGTGLAMSLQAYGTSGDGIVAAVLLNPDGTWDVQSDAVDMGNGSATTLGVVIGDILGANAATVEMGGYTLFDQTGLRLKGNLGCGEDPSWDNPFWTKKGVGSSSACLTGLHQVHVMQQCALAVFAQTILPAARLAWNLPDLQSYQTEWQDGALIYAAGGLPPLPLPDIAAKVFEAGLSRGAVAHGYFQQIWVSADFATATGTNLYQLDGLAFYPSDGGAAQPVTRANTQAMPAQTSRASRYVYAPCVDVIGVTVDRATGQTRVENAVSVLNAGRIHVPQLVSGQSQGGLAMAIGMTLHEDIPKGIDGPAGGTWNLNRYHVPRWGDVPLATTYAAGGRSQELIVLPESPQDERQGRGIAEAVMCSVAPAISNALRDAIGKRFTSLPITPAKILEGLGQ